jgi:hypothetical protein
MNNYKNGYHLNSNYWKKYKLTLPNLDSFLLEISIGVLLGDACMYHKGKNSQIKFEQSYIHKDYLFYLYELYKMYTFNEPYTRFDSTKIKSYSFRTFTHPTFNTLWSLFYKEGQKKINLNLIKDNLSSRGLAFWIMDDGSLQKDKKTMILHTQSYSYEENLILSKELNEKFNFQTKVISHKKIYWVIQFSNKDAKNLSNLIEPHLHPSMLSKLPKNN